MRNPAICALLLDSMDLVQLGDMRDSVNRSNAGRLTKREMGQIIKLHAINSDKQGRRTQKYSQLLPLYEHNQYNLVVSGLLYYIFYNVIHIAVSVKTSYFV